MMTPQNLVREGSLQPPQESTLYSASKPSASSRKRELRSTSDHDSLPEKKCRSYLSDEHSDQTPEFERLSSNSRASIEAWIGSIIELELGDPHQEPDNESIPESTKDFINAPQKRDPAWVHSRPTYAASIITGDPDVSDPVYRCHILKTRYIILAGEDGREDEAANLRPSYVKDICNQVTRVRHSFNRGNTPIDVGDEKLMSIFRRLRMQLPSGSQEIKSTIKCLFEDFVPPLSRNPFPIGEAPYPPRLAKSRGSPFLDTAVDDYPFGRFPSVATPAPDMTFGYRSTSFKQPGESPRTTGNVDDGLQLKRSEVTERGMIFPYLIVEVTDAGGDLWVATNRCMGGSAISLYLTEILAGFENVVFSVALHDTIAELYVMWSEHFPYNVRFPRKYNMLSLDVFELYKLDEFKRFWTTLSNIHEWAALSRFDMLNDKIRRMPAGPIPPPTDTNIRPDCPRS